ADADGKFTTTIAIGSRPVGSTFKVVAQTADRSFTLTSRDVKVIAQPVLQVIPARGPAGVTVTLRGTNWPANRVITVGRIPAASRTEIWFADKPVTDAAGTFSRN